MGLKAAFEEAVEGLKLIDFTTSDHNEINVFETTIRYLGGLLGAHDLTFGDPNHPYPVLLEKAIELGDMLYAAFDTPNRMPIANWKWKEHASPSHPFNQAQLTITVHVRGNPKKLHPVSCLLRLGHSHSSLPDYHNSLEIRSTSMPYNVSTMHLKNNNHLRNCLDCGRLM